MEYREQGGRGGNTKMHSLMERYLSVLTPTSANRCDSFNDARASDLALFSSGKILQKKHRIIPATLLHHSMPGISAALKLARRVACGNHATLTGGPDSLCQSDTMGIRFSVQKLEPTKQCFPPENERGQALPF